METDTGFGEWVAPCIRKVFGLSPRGSAKLADFLRGSDLYPDVLAELMMSARTRLARRAIQIESEPVDREGGFKRVWYDEDDRVLAITRACKIGDARQALLEVVVQACLAESGVAVPRILGTNVRIAGTPVCQLFQVTTVAEKMHCTLADRLGSDAFARLSEVARTNEIVMMISSMCRCVHKMHKHIGFVHGDLKPDNIMLRAEPAAATADMRDWYVIDFGLSKRAACSDMFFLCWWLANPYAKYIPPAVLASLRAALRVPRTALDAAKCAATLGPGDPIDFAGRVPRQKGLKPKSAQDETWVSKYGITKGELYDIQRTIVAPCFDPRAFYAQFVRPLYVSRP